VGSYPTPKTEVSAKEVDILDWLRLVFQIGANIFFHYKRDCWRNWNIVGMARIDLIVRIEFDSQ